MISRASVCVVVGLLLASAIVVCAQDLPQPASPIDAQVSTTMAQAVAADKAKHPEIAARLYWRIVDRFPNHREAPKAAKLAAYCTDKLKDRDASIAAFKSALQLYPTSEFVPAMKRCLALNYDAKGDKDSAIAELKDLITRFPKSDEACNSLINLGLLYVGQVGKQNTDAINWKHKDDADAAFKQLVDAFPTNRVLCAKAEMYRAGIALERARRKVITREAAKNQIERMLRNYPDAPAEMRARCEIMLAEMAFEAGRDTEAAKRAGEVVKNYPKCKLEVGWANYLCGAAEERLGDLPNALEHYNAVINGNYGKADNFKDRNVALYCLVRAGYCYANLGQTDIARKTFQRVVDDYPTSIQATGARSRLARMNGTGTTKQ